MSLKKKSPNPICPQTFNTIFSSQLLPLAVHSLLKSNFNEALQIITKQDPVVLTGKFVHDFDPYHSCVDCPSSPLVHTFVLEHLSRNTET